VRVNVENVSNGSMVEALWALGALEPKAARRRVGVWWKGCRKQTPKGTVFCHLFTDTETYQVIMAMETTGLVQDGIHNGLQSIRST
jgi:hypothetical protein